MRKTLKRGGGSLKKQIDLGKNAYVIDPTYPKSVASWPAWTSSPHAWPGPSCKGNYFKYNTNPKLPDPMYVGGKHHRKHTKHHKKHTKHHKKHTKHHKKHTKHHKKRTNRTKHNRKYKGGARWSLLWPFNTIEHELYYGPKRLYNEFKGKPSMIYGPTNLNPYYNYDMYNNY